MALGGQRQTCGLNLHNADARWQSNVHGVSTRLLPTNGKLVA